MTGWENAVRVGNVDMKRNVDGDVPMNVDYEGNGDGCRFVGIYVIVFFFFCRLSFKKGNLDGDVPVKGVAVGAIFVGQDKSR